MFSKWIPWLAALCVVLCSAAPRLILADTTTHKSGAWSVSDPDSLYHARRVERALLEEGLPAATDPFLNFPEGAAVPWPPYYDQLAAWVLGPFVRGGAQGAGRDRVGSALGSPVANPVESAERNTEALPAPSQQLAKDSARQKLGIDRGALERGVGRLPFLFGVLTSLLAFAAARQIAGTLAGFSAGCLHALAMGSIVYSRVGNGDHHAFYAMLSGAILWGMSFALQGKRLNNKRQALALGVGLGTLIGLAMGSWVAALLLVLLIDGLFAVLLFLQGRTPRAGLAHFGLSLHATALLVILPAVLQSPWKAEFPWMVVNLSWFHPTLLGLGALVFVPLFFIKDQPRLVSSYPWMVGAGLLLLALCSLLIEAGPLDGIREGFAWVSRQDSFMAHIDESRPLFGEGAVPDGVSIYLGGFFWLIPIAWLFACVRILKGACLQLLPWVVALPALLFQALGQVRFTDTLIGPAGVLVAWFVVTQLPWSRLRKLQAMAVPAAILMVGLSQASTCLRLGERLAGGQEDPRPKRARRELCEWIAINRPNPNSAVLAPWALGHELEWIAQRPSVATNFGSYVGLEGYLSPGRFFLSLDPAEAEAVLLERQADLVVLGCGLSSSLPGWIQAGPKQWHERYYRLDTAGDGQLLAAWFESVGGQLLNGGHGRVPRGTERGDSLNFLRLLHASPILLAQSPISDWKGPAPYGWVWERVRGAQVSFEGEPGTPVSVAIELAYPGRANQPEQSQTFLARGTISQDRHAKLRVPYNTLERNGDGRVVGAQWSQGATSGSLRIPERAVLEGLALPARP